jgi:hypothetical protein
MDVLLTNITKKQNYNGTKMHVLIVNEQDKIFRIEHYKRNGRNLFESIGFSNFADLESAECNFFSDNFGGPFSLSEHLDKRNEE